MSDGLVTDRALQGDRHALGERLHKVGRDAARVSQVACDERFLRWLAWALQLPAVKLQAGRLAPPLLMLTVRTAQGDLRVGLPERALPLSAACALGLQDKALACEVLSEVLADSLGRFAPALSEMRIVAFERRERPATGFALDLARHRFALCGANPPLLQHMSQLLPRIAAEVLPWGELRVRARLRLMVRHWSAAFIQSLACGDVVLIGTADDARHKLITGTGYTMQVDTNLSLESGQVEISGETSMAHDSLDVAQTAGHVEDLQLPVAFEIDTARISLAELASMRPGYVVELDAPLSQAAVRLVCHGQVVGQGQLLAVGDQLGVRIVRMGVGRAAAAGR